MLTLTADSSNHYRTWLEQGVLRFERKVTGTKVAVGASVTFDATTHAFWRIRHDAGTDEIVFETAPRVRAGDVGGAGEDPAHDRDRGAEGRGEGGDLGVPGHGARHGARR